MSKAYQVFGGGFFLLLTMQSAGFCRAVAMPLRERVARSRVIARVRIREGGALNSPGEFRHTVRAPVLVPVKGVVKGQVVTFDYDNGLRCPNVLYTPGEECLVFLRPQRNGRLATVDQQYGKYRVEGDTVRGWSVNRSRRQDVPLAQAVRQIRRIASN